MFQPGFTLRYTSKVRAVTLTPVADDLALAHVKLRVYRFSWGLALIVAGALGLAGFALYEFFDRTPWLYPALLLLGLLSPTMFDVLPRIRKADFNVRKLVVRCGKQWRLFCGDWEGWEEADLSWLDETSSC